MSPQPFGKLNVLNDLVVIKIPTTQKSCVVYEFSCRCEDRYVGRTTQGLADSKTTCSPEHQ